ncbi:hypothetical protein KM043_017802 [Ampulex compressa]|nr:hypothetical protein KM043_017802 [Ampulex compressa]
MIIPLRRSGDLDDWAIIELQGDLKFDSSKSRDQYIGDLHFTKSGTPILVIGIHVLHGKEMDLAKPIAILEKKSILSSDTSKDCSDTEYVVKAIVKKKLIFKARPKPIITNVPKCN